MISDLSFSELWITSSDFKPVAACHTRKCSVWSFTFGKTSISWHGDLIVQQPNSQEESI